MFNTVNSRYNEQPPAARFCSLYPEVHYNESGSLCSRIGHLANFAKSLQNSKNNSKEEIPFCGYFRISCLNVNDFVNSLQFIWKFCKIWLKNSQKEPIFYHLPQICSLYPEFETVAVHYTGSDIWSKKSVSPKMFIISGGSL